MQPSIAVADDLATQYLLRIGDTALILAQRLGEWTGHAPVLEEDIALANMALDLVGQARAVLSHAGATEGAGHDEDQLAFLREERDYRNATLVELPRGDFAFTVLRNAVMASFFKQLWQKLARSSDAELAAIAGKAIKEARYHQQHAADWVVRLAQGTDESRRRVDAALADLWRFTAELFASDAVDAQAAQSMISGYRHNNGLSAVTLDPELMAIAEHQATVMAARNKLDHNVDGSLSVRLRKAGYKAAEAAENISAGYHTLAEAFSGWRDSPPHRKNMLLAGATRMGIAAVYTPGSKYKVFWAMVLAKPMERRRADAEPTVQVLR